MKQFGIAMAISVALLMSLGLGSCATTSLKTVEPSITLTLETPASLKTAKMGIRWDENPYLEPSGLVTGKQNEFVVLRLDLCLPEKTAVDLIADVSDQAGKKVAQYKNLEQMRQFWGKWESDKALNNQRSLTLTQTYTPDKSFVAKAGVSHYYLVLMGKNPLPRPATIYVQAAVQGMETKVWEMPLPEAETK